MNIFIINTGSSSLKCHLYSLQGIPSAPIPPLWETSIQWKNNFEDLHVKIKTQEGTESFEALPKEILSQILLKTISYLTKGKTAIINSLEDIHAIGHRIVHGGKEFSQSEIITKEVKAKILQFSELAPSHNLLALECIKTLETVFIKTPQFAVFDTAFHHTLPPAASIYPGPYEWYKEGIQRYGFHGISFQYCSKRVAHLLKKGLTELKMVICHLGSGASVCAIKEGKSIDTTMGFTPLDGLMMDTRSGSIDPGIILYLLEKKQKTTKEISKTLYEQSGLLGISGFSSDMKDIQVKSLEGDERATLALDIYLHRLTSCIGSMITSLQGIDVLVFTGGIGENSPILRKRTCEILSFLGLKLDLEKNAQNSSKDSLISSYNSAVQILLIHTQEAFEIALECQKLAFKT